MPTGHVSLTRYKFNSQFLSTSLNNSFPILLEYFLLFCSFSYHDFLVFSKKRCLLSKRRDGLKGVQLYRVRINIEKKRSREFNITSSTDR